MVHVTLIDGGSAITYDLPQWRLRECSGLIGLPCKGGITVSGVELPVFKAFVQYMQQDGELDLKLEDTLEDTARKAASESDDGLDELSDTSMTEFGDVPLADDYEYWIGLGIKLWVFARELGCHRLQNATIKQLHQLVLEAYRVGHELPITAEAYHWVWTNTDEHSTVDTKLRDFIIKAHLAFRGPVNVEADMPVSFYRQMIEAIAKRPAFVTEEPEAGAKHWRRLKLGKFEVQMDSSERPALPKMETDGFEDISSEDDSMVGDGKISSSEDDWVQDAMMSAAFGDGVHGDIDESTGSMTPEADDF